ncbi:MAG TPA: DNA polymerase I [Terriglobales bacterium]|nr:DNA polymerase I [Terriglobales bacterium]
MPQLTDEKLDASPPAALTPEAKGRVFLIDAFSFIFRAYHAMARARGMSTKTGIPTSASYVFINMLRKLRDDFHPEYLAAIFDPAGPTFRDTQAATVTAVRKFDLKTQTFQEIEYKGYKANRKEMPGDLAQQIPYIRRALEAYRIPILEVAGFEADDVIGTLACQAAELSYPVYVVSSDKDMLQLVNEKVLVLNPPKDNLIADRAKVEEILGVPPERVIDVMALRGDSIDNIPGAPGIGDKGSVDLIQRFGTVEAALDRAQEVERKTYRESLLQNRENILWSKQLATIDCNVPITLDLEPMRSADPKIGELRALFTELEFTSLLKDLVSGIDLSQTDYRDAKSPKEVADALSALPAGAALAVALDFTADGGETGTPDESLTESDEEQAPLLVAATMAAPPTVRNIAVSPTSGKAWVINWDDAPTAAKLKSILSDPGIPKSVHDYKSAMQALEQRGIALAGVRDEPMLYSYLLDPTYSSHRLPEIALRKFNLNLSGSLAESADVTYRFAESLRKEIEQAGLAAVYRDIDLPLLPVLAGMEKTGVKIDCDVLAEMSRRLDREIGAVARKIYDAAGTEFNINSPRKLGDVLFNQLNLPKPVKYGKGKMISTAVDVLEALALQHEVPKLVLEYRQLSKLKSTYVDALPALLNQCTQRLHTTFDQTNTATGRLSSKNPNLQNIPIRTELGREIRAAFIAEPGCVLMSADYSQIELRLLAHFSEDKLLVDAFRRGDDIHTLTAAQVFGVPPLMVNAEHRRRAKVVNFGIVYGLSAFGLSQQLSIEPKEAKQFIDAYFEKYYGVRAFIDRTLDAARRDQRVRTLFGRIRPIPDINSKNANQRGFAERTAVNTPLQGTAADLIKLAMIQIDAELRERKLKSRMTLQVHDELVFEVPEDEVEIMRRLVREKMENVHPLRVPLLVELGVGPNWRDLE